MGSPAFKVWRVLEEQEVTDEQNHRYQVITKKEFAGEIVNPKEEIYVTWMELAEQFGEGYYLVKIPREIREKYVVPAEQRVKTPLFIERKRSSQRKEGGAIWSSEGIIAI